MKASAYLLFRQTSTVLYLFHNKTLAHVNINLIQSNETLYYKTTLKPIITCFKIIRACLSGRLLVLLDKSLVACVELGNYVNFGVFHLYSDPCFDQCLQVFLALLTSLPKSHILAYPKLSASYFSLIETFSLVHMEFLAHLSIPLFGYVLDTIGEGLLTQQADIQTSCCIYLDTFLSFVFRLVKKQCAPTNVMLNMSEYEHVFRQILINLLNTIIFAECK
jgi:hypothetical protein